MKYYDKIAYSYHVESEPGIFEEAYHEQYYYGDVIQNGRYIRNNDKINDDVTVNTRISVIADAALNHNFGSIRWVEFMGQKWKAESVVPEPPRLVITLGSLYHESKYEGVGTNGN